MAHFINAGKKSAGVRRAGSGAAKMRRRRETHVWLDPVALVDTLTEEEDRLAATVRSSAARTSPIFLDPDSPTTWRGGAPPRPGPSPLGLSLRSAASPSPTPLTSVLASPPGEEEGGRRARIRRASQEWDNITAAHRAALLTAWAAGKRGGEEAAGDGDSKSGEAERTVTLDRIHGDIAGFRRARAGPDGFPAASGSPSAIGKLPKRDSDSSGSSDMSDGRLGDSSRKGGRVLLGADGRALHTRMRGSSTLARKLTPALRLTTSARRTTGHARVLHPQGTVKTRWDIVLTLLILYTVLVVPWRIGFNQDAEGGWLIVDWFIDVFFLLDLCVNFRTAFYAKDGVLVWDTRAIARQYLMGWFFIDFFSSVPFDRLAFAISGSGDPAVRGTRLLRILRLVRLLKLFRVLKLGRVFGIVEKDVAVNQYLVSLVKLMVGITFVAHVFGCFWFWIATFEEDSTGWVDVYNMRDADPTAQYFTALYWAFTTMTTVGYGDISAASTGERLYSIVAMILGASIFGYVVGNVSVLVENLDPRKALLREKMHTIKSYLRDRGAPFSVIRRVRRHLQYMYSHKTVFDEGALHHRLPNSLRAELVAEVYSDYVAGIRFFSRLQRDVLSYLLPFLRPQFYEEGEAVFVEGHLANGIYYVLSGTVELIAALDTDHDWFVRQIGAGFSFGELEVMKSLPRCMTARTVAEAELLMLNKDDLMRVIQLFPRLQSDLNNLANMSLQEQARASAAAASTGRRLSRELPSPVESGVAASGEGGDVELVPVRSRTRTLGGGVATRLTTPGQPQLGLRAGVLAELIDAPSIERTSPPLPVASGSAGEAAPASKARLKVEQRSAVEAAVAATLALRRSPSPPELVPEIAGHEPELEREPDMAAVAAARDAKLAREAEIIPPPAIRLSLSSESVDFSAADAAAADAAAAAAAATATAAAAAAGAAARPSSPAESGLRMSGSLESSGGYVDEFNEADDDDEEERVTGSSIEAAKAAPAAAASAGAAEGDGNGDGDGDGDISISASSGSSRAKREAERKRLSLTLSGVELTSEKAEPQIIARSSSQNGSQRREEKTSQELAKQWILHPESATRLSWDAFLALFIIYTTITVPYDIAFNVSLTGGWVVLEWLIDTCFLLDILLNLRTAYHDKEGALVYKPSLICKHYCRTWLAVDLLSTLPVETVFPLVLESRSPWLRTTRLIKVLRLARLLKLMRLVRLSRFLGKSEDVLQLHPAVWQIVRLVVSLCFISHIYACVWYGAASFQADDVQTWPKECEQGNYCPVTTGNSSRNLELYVASLYWAFATITTVGYGDIRPQPRNSPELVVAMASMMLGTAIFAYIIGAMMNLVLNWDAATFLSKRQTDALKDYLRGASLSKPFMTRVRQQFEHNLLIASAFDEAELLSDLPHMIRLELARHVHTKVLARIPFFNDMENRFPGFMAYLWPLFRPSLFNDNEVIVQAGDSLPTMYFITRGTVVVRGLPSRIHRLGEGDFFGEAQLLTDASMAVEARVNIISASDEVSLLSLNREELFMVELTSPAVVSAILEYIMANSSFTEEEQAYWVRYVAPVSARRSLVDPGIGPRRLSSPRAADATAAVDAVGMQPPPPPLAFSADSAAAPRPAPRV